MIRLVAPDTRYRPPTSQPPTSSPRPGSSATARPRGPRSPRHATEALRQAIPLGAAHGIPRLLVTCAEDNAGSRAVIEANGGVYEDSRNGTRRYWIDTSG